MNARIKSSPSLKQKSTKRAYLMWCFFGFHNAYLGNWIRQLIFIILVISSYVLYIIDESDVFINPTSIGFWAFIIAMIWYMLDLFLIPNYVIATNKKQKQRFENTERIVREELEEMIKQSKS